MPARRALIPSIPASTTQGSLFGSQGLPLATRRFCQLWATCHRSVWVIRLSSMGPTVDSAACFCCCRLVLHAGGGRVRFWLFRSTNA
jgi:hypothetical protein